MVLLLAGVGKQTDNFDDSFGGGSDSILFVNYHNYNCVSHNEAVIINKAVGGRIMPW